MSDSVLEKGISPRSEKRRGLVGTAHFGRTRRKPVFGEGKATAAMLIVGEILRARRQRWADLITRTGHRPIVGGISLGQCKLSARRKAVRHTTDKHALVAGRRRTLENFLEEVRIANARRHLSGDRGMRVLHLAAGRPTGGKGVGSLAPGGTAARLVINPAGERATEGSIPGSGFDGSSDSDKARAGAVHSSA